LDQSKKAIKKDVALFFCAVWRNMIREVSYDSIAAAIATLMIHMYLNEDYSEEILNQVQDKAEYRKFLEKSTDYLQNYVHVHFEKESQKETKRRLSWSILFQKETPNTNAFSILN
jgi:hypothetical protein